MKLPVCTIDIQVRYSDTDAMGHLSNEAYLTYLQQGRLALFEEIRKQTGWAQPIVMASTSADFVQECFYGDHLSVTTWCEHKGTKSLTLYGEVFANGTLVSRGRATHVGFDKQTRTSVPLPEHWEASDVPAR